MESFNSALFRVTTVRFLRAFIIIEQLHMFNKTYCSLIVNMLH